MVLSAPYVSAVGFIKWLVVGSFSPRPVTLHEVLVYLVDLLLACFLCLTTVSQQPRSEDGINREHSL